MISISIQALIPPLAQHLNKRSLNHPSRLLAFLLAQSSSHGDPDARTRFDDLLASKVFRTCDHHALGETLFDDLLEESFFVFEGEFGFEGVVGEDGGWVGGPWLGRWSGESRIDPRLQPGAGYIGLRAGAVSASVVQMRSFRDARRLIRVIDTSPSVCSSRPRCRGQADKRSSAVSTNTQCYSAAA